MGRENNQKFKIATYNIHRGLSAFRKTSIREKLALVLKHVAADIVCLQEVWTDNPHLEPQLEELTQHIWTHQAYGKNVVFDQGHQGNVIVSRYPIRNWFNLDLSVPGAEPRGSLFAEIELPDHTPIMVVCQHWGLSEKERSHQFNQLKEYVLNKVNPTIPFVLAGDFNDWRRKMSVNLRAQLGLLEAHRQKNGSYARTFPSIFPFFHLDRIYFRNCFVEDAKVHSELRWKGLSDHLPIEATFSIL